MDPNETLRNIRELMTRLAGAADDGSYIFYAGKAAEHFQALDQWLTRGGFLPDAWDHSECGGGDR